VQSDGALLLYSKGAVEELTRSPILFVLYEERGRVDVVEWTWYVRDEGSGCSVVGLWSVFEEGSMLRCTAVMGCI
jgi:hypothetical protein